MHAVWGVERQGGIFKIHCAGSREGLSEDKSEGWPRATVTQNACPSREGCHSGDRIGLLIVPPGPTWSGLPGALLVGLG